MNTYAIIKDGTVINKILALNSNIAQAVSGGLTVVLDNDNTYSIGDDYSS